VIALIILVLLGVAVDPAPAKPLTMGSPAPPLASMAFIRGEVVKELKQGTTYVIEFSGTNCGPCIRCIPHMNALQKKHAEVVFISVFGEEEKTVRAFLDDKGKAMALRVAADPKGVMGKRWSDAACREGIPHAFIVGKNGKIAWIGHPNEMAEPLAAILAGTFNAQETILRLKVDQEAALRLRRAEKREEQGRAEYRRINDLIIDGKLKDALKATEKALVEYRDATQTIELLRAAQIYLLANLPGQRDKAFDLAMELAIKAKAMGQSSVMTRVALSLLNAAERAKPTDRDTRLIDLGLALLHDESPLDLRSKPDHVREEYQIARLQFTGYAYHLRGDSNRAAGSIRDAIAQVRALKPATGVDATAFESQAAERIKRLEESLKEYEGNATPAKP